MAPAVASHSKRLAERALESEAPRDADSWYALGADLEATSPRHARDAYRRALDHRDGMPLFSTRFGVELETSPGGPASSEAKRLLGVWEALGPGNIGPRSSGAGNSGTARFETGNFGIGSRRSFMRLGIAGFASMSLTGIMRLQAASPATDARAPIPATKM